MIDKLKVIGYTFDHIFRIVNFIEGFMGYDAKWAGFSTNDRVRSTHKNKDEILCVLTKKILEHKNTEDESFDKQELYNLKCCIVFLGKIYQISNLWQLKSPTN